MYRYADNQGVTYAADADAGCLVEITKKSHWFRYGGTYGYGVLYPRLAHTLACVSPSSRDPGFSPQEDWEFRVHFGLMGVSLLSLLAICWLVADAVCLSRGYRNLAWAGLVWAFGHSRTWAAYVYQAHPDILLALCFVGMLVMGRKFLADPSRRKGAGLGLCAAAAVSAKFSMVMAVPCLLLLAAPPWSGAWRRAGRILVPAGAGFFLLGFPQNFRLGEYLDKWQHQQKLVLPGTWDSLAGWLGILAEQLWLPGLVLLWIAFWMGRPGTDHGSRPLFRLWCLVLVPFALVASRNILSSHDHYVLPTSAGLAWLWAATLRPAQTGLRPAWWPGVTGLMLLTGMVIWPAGYEATVRGLLAGRGEIREAYREIKAYLDSGKRVLVEAYIPYPAGHPNLIIGGHLSVTPDFVRQQKPDIIVVNRTQVDQILDPQGPSSYLRAGRENFDKIWQHYSNFKKNKKTSFKLKKLLSNNLEIWSKNE